jgi:hypothetical protein
MNRMPPLNISKTGTILFRIALALAIMAGAMIATLKLLETSGEPLREGFQSYLAQVTHSRVYVTALPNPKFFPDVHVTAQNMVFSDMEDPKKKLANVDLMEFSIPFVNLLISRQEFESFTIGNLTIEKDVVLPRQLHIEKAAVENGPVSAVMKATGKYGAEALTATIDLTKHEGTPVYYSLPHHTPFEFILGDITLKGEIDSVRDNLTLQNVVMTGKNGGKYGPAKFPVMKKQEFVKDNPVSCLLDQKTDLKLTDAHPCAKIFELTPDQEEK